MTDDKTPQTDGLKIGDQAELMAQAVSLGTGVRAAEMAQVASLCTGIQAGQAVQAAGPNSSQLWLEPRQE